MRIPILFLFLFITAPGWEPALGQDDKGMASYTFKGSFVDTYIFRGHVFNDDATLLGEAGIGIGKWSYNLIYAKPDDERTAPFEEEFNHSVSYTTIKGRRVTTFGYQAYDYNGLQPDTQEFFSRVSTLTKWRPTYGIAFDFDTYKGFYLDYSIARRYPLTRRSQLDFSIQGGIAYELEEEVDDQGRVTEPGFFGDDGFTSALARLKYVWQPLTWFTLETGIEYHYAFDDFLYRDERIDKSNTVWRSSLTIRFP